MTDENLMPDVDAFTNERMRLNLAETADHRPRLNFDEGTNERVVSYATSIEIY